MTDPLLEVGELDAALALAAEEARRYVATLDDAPVVPPGAEAAIERWHDPMPEQGDGSLARHRRARRAAALTPHCARAGPTSFTS